MKCKKCGKSMKKIMVSVEGTNKKAKSYQCRCGYFEFENKSSKNVVDDLKEHELALWSMKQAVAYKEGKLSREKVKKLKSIKFPFEYYLKMAKEFDTFEIYSCRVRMTEDELMDGKGYPDVITKGYYIIGDMVFVMAKDLIEWTRTHRLTKQEFESVLKSQNLIIIEVIG